MGERKKKKVNWQQWIVMGFFMLIGAVCGVLMVMFVEESAAEGRPLHEELLTLAGLFVGMYISMFLQLIIHEAGHLVFGLASGYQFSSFRVGSFMWLKEDGRLVLRRYSLAGTGGQCLMAPPEMVDGRIPVVLYNLGGSIMNLIASAVFFAVYLLTDKGSVISVLSLMTTLIGVVFALMNGIPLRLGTVDNDGYNALSLGKSKEAMYAFWIQLKVNEQISKGVRSKDMPEEWFAVPTDEAMRNSMVASQGVFACNRLMDQKRFEEADRLMEHLMGIESGIIGLHRSMLICDWMYCELIGENRRDVLDSVLTKEQKQFMKSMKKYPSVLRTEYVYALLGEKDNAKAEGYLELFEKTSRTYPYPSEIKAERELIEIAQAVAASKPTEV